MKKITLLAIITVFTMNVKAQKYFDSANYVNYYVQQWRTFQIDTTTYTKPLTNEEKIVGLSKCWSEAKYNFANFDLIPSVNWDSLYQSFIPQVLKTQSNHEYFNTLKKFYYHLRDGHTAIIEPYYLTKNNKGKMPLKVKWVEGKAVISKIESTDAPFKNIKPGYEIVAINHTPLQQYVADNITPYLHFSTPQDSIARIYNYELFTGPTGKVYDLTLKDNNGKTLNTSLLLVENKLGWRPASLIDFTVLPGNIGYLQLHSFNWKEIVAQYDSLFPQIKNTNSLIIDIRDNGGGSGSNGFEIIGTLTDKPFYQGKTALRQYTPIGRQWGGVEELQINGYDWKPYKKMFYDKEVVLLTSPQTYSAAEDFTSAFKSVNRGKIIGQPTGGSTGQPISFNLPGGGSGRVCGKRDYFYNGIEFVGLGIQPDIKVDETIQGITQGRDEVLEAAVKYLKK